ncbi:MAG: isopentenyl-diphosphate delta-isomerase [Bacteroidetes bacterium GWF2_42_66]|nr:MAG: isopentenyl-diphosphate delta-isomerase [Bacteroidetes bacterium GWE2_42_39]OFY43446.1 MAG: isopentenyl-diphosphate delta-isomerase [Bacteroidetes bacterium GWF2_42_66]HBL76530.1 type 2 isopentenyl-diphosphate Delta-isomerase [Prolixibacteraceae bacterium]HCU63825.1 type 2 isopentenyl-diphosphate Delta-isomerase [Prolixibacteraceae bacterium]
MNQDRKSDHIQLALESQGNLQMHDKRFIYEPLLSAHPKTANSAFPFLGKTMQFPLWISSMTGGTAAARKINENLARACREFGLGMGLGSCRKILFDDTVFADFDWRDTMGNDRPFYANLGIAQVEQLLEKKQQNAIDDLIGRLRADGLIVHVNPLQEWFQPEGDRIRKAPVETIEKLLATAGYPVIIKEVGQGMGPESLRRLLKLPLAAVEFAAFGGTNFSKLELIRTEGKEAFEPFVHVGQTALQMVQDVNELVSTEKDLKCHHLIISGGVKNALDGYFYSGLSRLPSVFGMASAVLQPASESYGTLKEFIEQQIEQYRLAKAFLKINFDYAE